MGSEWTETTLGDVSTEVSYGYTESATTEKVGPHFLRITDIQNGVVDWSSVPFCPIDDSKLKKYLLKRGDIVVARTGNSTGENYIYTGIEDTVFASYLIRFRIDRSKVDPFYVWYNMRSQSWWDFVSSSKTGSAQAGANAKLLRLFPLSFPDIYEQKSIAHILGTLDDKIELNRQMNATLEAMAQALFKSWFVDFDPVIDNALAAGNSIPEPLQAKAEVRAALGDQRKPLPEAIQKQFPSRFVFSEEMGWIPEGWEVVPVTTMVDTISDTYPFKNKDKVIFLNTGDILEGTFLHNDFSDVPGLPGQAKKSIQYGDILFSEIRPKNKRYAFVDFESKEYVVSTKLMVLRSKGRFDSLFPYFLLKQSRTIDYLQHIAESRSGTFPQITYTQLDQVGVAIPSDDSVHRYFTSSVLRDNFRKSQFIHSNISTLGKIRDTLLPKLLSGELRIPDAEKLVADSV